MNLTRLISLALATTLSLSLLSACTAQNTDLDIPDVSIPNVPLTDIDTPQVEDTDDQAITPELDTPGTDLPVADIPTTGDIALSHSDFTLFTPGERCQLTISNLLEGDMVSYQSDNTDIATVSEDGLVTAVAPGTANITATVVLDGITSLEFTAIARCSFQVEEVVTLDFSSFYDELLSSQLILAPLVQSEGDFLAIPYPTIGDYDFAQVAVYAPMMSSVAYELAFIQVNNSADVPDAIALLQARIDAQVAGGAWYPAEIDVWTNSAQIVSNGNYVIMVACQNAQDIIDAFNAKF